MIFTNTLNTGNIAVEYTKNIDTSSEERSHYCITDSDVMVLTDYAIKVENHYSNKAGSYKPMDMEWAKDGLDGQLYMVQARPETVSSQKKGNILEIYHLKERSAVLLRGRAVGTKIGAGKA
ncbi:phosphoenolpyruvate synthase, partial [mine drainage metagenome]